jgi:hypothetical protein
VVISELHWRRLCFQAYSHGFLAGLRSLLAFAGEISSLQFGLLHSFTYSVTPFFSCIKSSVGMRGESFCNLILEVVCYYFCCILFIRSLLLDPTHSLRFHNGVNTRRQRSFRALLNTAYHSSIRQLISPSFVKFFFLGGFYNSILSAFLVSSLASFSVTF